MKSVTLNIYTYKELKAISEDDEHPLHDELKNVLGSVERHLSDHILKCYNEKSYYYKDDDEHLREEYRYCYAVPRIEDEDELEKFIKRITPVVAEQHQMYFNDMGLPMEVDGIRFVPFYVVGGEEMYHLICQYTNYTDTL